MKTPEEINGMTPEEIKAGLQHCTTKYFCNGCPIESKCNATILLNALNRIEQLEETISLMKIQMQGDCGVCKHRHDERVKEDAQFGCRLSPACYECLSKGGRSHWEYEGLPGV